MGEVLHSIILKDKFYNIWIKLRVPMVVSLSLETKISNLTLLHNKCIMCQETTRSKILDLSSLVNITKTWWDFLKYKKWLFLLSHKVTNLHKPKLTSKLHLSCSLHKTYKYNLYSLSKFKLLLPNNNRILINSNRIIKSFPIKKD